MKKVILCEEMKEIWPYYVSKTWRSNSCSSSSSERS